MIEKLPYLSDAHHYALAAVTTRSAQMEHNIEHALNIALFGKPLTAEYLLRNLGQEKLVGAMQATLKDALPADRGAGIDAIVDRIKAARTERNEMVHWLYGASEDTDQALLATIRPYREKREKLKTAAEFQAVADEMLAISQSLLLVMIDLLKQNEIALAKLKAENEDPRPAGFSSIPSLHSQFLDE